MDGSSIKKEIQPFSEAQKEFIKVAEENSEGNTIFEEAWINFESECRINEIGQWGAIDPRFIPSSRLENELETYPHSKIDAYDINREDEYDWRDDYGEDS